MLRSGKKRTVKNKPDIANASDYGLDIAMLKANLKRTYAQRIRRHQIALDTMQKLRKAKFL